MLFHVLTIHNLTVVACWQKQLRWRTRAGSSPGCPSLHSHCWPDASQAASGWGGCCCFPELPPLLCPAFIRGGDAQVPSSASPRSLPSHLTYRKGNPGDWAGQEPQLDSHLCKQRTRPAKRYQGEHTPYSPKHEKLLKAHWHYCAVMCLTLFLLGMFLPPSSIPPCLSDVSFSAVSNTDNKLLEAEICQEQYSSSAKGLAGCTKNGAEQMTSL